VQPRDRYQSMAEFKEALMVTTEVQAVEVQPETEPPSESQQEGQPEPQQEPQYTEPDAKRKRKWLENSERIFLVISGICFALSGVLYLCVIGMQSSFDKDLPVATLFIMKSYILEYYSEPQARTIILGVLYIIFAVFLFNKLLFIKKKNKGVLITSGLLLIIQITYLANILPADGKLVLAWAGQNLAYILMFAVLLITEIDLPEKIKYIAGNGCLLIVCVYLAGFLLAWSFYDYNRGLPWVVPLASIAETGGILFTSLWCRKKLSIGIVSEKNALLKQSGGMCFALYGLYCLLISTFVLSKGYNITPFRAIINLVLSIVYIGFAVQLFRKKKDLIIVVGLLFVLHTARCFENFLENVDGVTEIFSSAAYALILTVFIINAIALPEKVKRIASHGCLLAAFVHLVGVIAYWHAFHFVVHLPDMIPYIVETAAILLVGLWYRKEISQASPQFGDVN
ncbi:MAG: hypothetical protein J1F02_03495, partial [Lachnospiraceae bacterium]|nr:hypothetical protein [Lachnospiraceae bacterium]